MHVSVDCTTTSSRIYISHICELNAWAEQTAILQKINSARFSQNKKRDVFVNVELVDTTSAISDDLIQHRCDKR